MASLGGLDVAYGSQLQLVRTNVLIVETDATTTKAMAEVVHSVASQVSCGCSPRLYLLRR